MRIIGLTRGVAQDAWGRREEGTEARMRRLSSPMNRHGWVCPNGAKGAANGKDLDY